MSQFGQGINNPQYGWHNGQWYSGGDDAYYAQGSGNSGPGGGGNLTNWSMGGGGGSGGGGIGQNPFAPNPSMPSQWQPSASNPWFNGGSWSQGPPMGGAGGNGFGGGGWNPGQTQIPDQWGHGQYSMVSPLLQQGFEGNAPQASIDTQGVIAAQMPRINEERDLGFAQAGKRFGQTGMLMSGGYANALGEVQRKAANDATATRLGYEYNSAQQDAQRQLQAQQSALDRSLSAYGTNSGQQFSGDQAAGDRAYGAWAQEGNWDQANQQMMMQLMGNMLGGFGGSGGGWY